MEILCVCQIADEKDKHPPRQLLNVHQVPKPAAYASKHNQALVKNLRNHRFLQADQDFLHIFLNSNKVEKL